MAIVFYEAPMSSATPVAWALTELKVPHEKVRFDLSKGDQKKPEFLRLNPNGKVPTLVVDGTPMFEAVAIMMWLGECFGVEQKLWPAVSDPLRLQAFSWSVWAYVTYGSNIGRYALATSERLGPEYRSSAQAAYAKKEGDALLEILGSRLGKQPYLLGEDFSLVDVIVASSVGYGVMVGLTVDEHPHVKSWLERCQSRPACRAVWS